LTVDCQHFYLSSVGCASGDGAAVSGAGDSIISGGCGGELGDGAIITFGVGVSGVRRLKNPPNQGFRDSAATFSGKGVASGVRVNVGCGSGVASGVGVNVGCGSGVTCGIGVNVGCGSGVACGIGVNVGCGYGVTCGIGVNVGCGSGVTCGIGFNVGCGST